MYVISLPFDNQNRVKIITVEHRIIKNSFVCECGYTLKSGIGCSHIMKVLIHTKKPILYFGVAPEWRIEEEDSILLR